MYQPINIYAYESHDSPSCFFRLRPVYLGFMLVPGPGTRTNECRTATFNKQSAPGSRFMAVTKVTIPFNYLLKLHIIKHKSCNANAYHIYDGPGVLSAKLNTNEDLYTYKASSFQILVIIVFLKYCNMKDPFVNCNLCHIKYSGTKSNPSHITNVASSSAFTWNSENPKDGHLCSVKTSVRICAVQFLSAQSITINLTHLSGIRHISYSEQQLTRKSSQTEDPVGLCYYGAVFLGLWSGKDNELKYNTISLCMLPISHLETLWFSSKHKLDIFLFSYKMYSDIEVSFNISITKCKVISIEICNDIKSHKNAFRNFYDGLKIATMDYTSRSTNSSEFYRIIHFDIENEVTCFHINIMKVKKAKRLLEEQCINYRLDFLSSHPEVKGISVVGHMTINYFKNYKQTHPFLQIGKEKGQSFKSSSYKIITAKGKFIYVKVKTGVAEIQTISAGFIVDTYIRCVTNITNYPLYVDNLKQLITERPKCYKILFHPGREVHVKIKTFYSRDFFMKPIQILHTIQERSCYSILPSYYSNVVHNYYSNGTPEILLQRSVTLTETSHLYIDSNLEIHKKYKRALMSLVKDKADQSNFITLQEQLRGQCYDYPVSTVYMNERNMATGVLFGSTEYLGHKYKLYHKIRGKAFSNYYLQCEHDSTVLDLYEPELVTWNYAEKHCKDSNMTLLTLGSKEEELHAVSLQTALSRDRNRYEAQLIFLGLRTKVSNKLVRNKNLCVAQFFKSHCSQISGQPILSLDR